MVAWVGRGSQQHVVRHARRCLKGFKRRRVEDFCNKIHRTLMQQFKHALVWGASAKHNPQTVGKDHILEDGDVVEIVKKVG